MHCVNNIIQWKEVDCRIKRWRTQREILLGELETGVIIASIKPASLSATRHHLTLSKTPYREIKRLCEQMLDYVSAGHFEMYSQLLEEGSHLKGRAKMLISSIYKRIERSTDQALDFSDKYDADELSINDEPALPKDISNLNLALTTRFALEDQLIALLHESQKPVSLSG